MAGLAWLDFDEPSDVRSGSRRNLRLAELFARFAAWKVSLARGRDYTSFPLNLLLDKRDWWWKCRYVIYESMQTLNRSIRLESDRWSTVEIRDVWNELHSLEALFADDILLLQISFHDFEVEFTDYILYVQKELRSRAAEVAQLKGYKAFMEDEHVFQCLTPGSESIRAISNITASLKALWEGIARREKELLEKNGSLEDALPEELKQDCALEYAPMNPARQERSPSANYRKPFGIFRISPIILMSDYATGEKITATPIVCDSTMAKPRTHVEGILNGVTVNTVPDNCSTHNIIPLVDAQKLNVTSKVVPGIHYFGLPNRSVMESRGTITMPFAYSDQPNRIDNLLFYVVDKCPSGIILGKQFLKKTQLLAKENLHRVKRCLSSLSTRMSFRLIDNTSQRLHGLIANASGNDEQYAAVLDLGADRNVMALPYAKAKHYHIKRGRKHRGTIVFADGTEHATVGQVTTWWTFASGVRAPVTFEVLPECFADVVLGDEFIWENQVYYEYAESIQDMDREPDTPEVHSMGWKQKWHDHVAKLARALGIGSESLASTSSSVDRTANVAPSYDHEMQRQQEWNEQFDEGHSASHGEWHLEHRRRERFEEQWSPGWRFDPTRKPLIGKLSPECPGTREPGLACIVNCNG